MCFAPVTPDAEFIVMPLEAACTVSVLHRGDRSFVYVVKTRPGRFCTLSHGSLFKLLACIYVIFACKFPRGKNELIE